MRDKFDQDKTRNRGLDNLMFALVTNNIDRTHNTDTPSSRSKKDTNLSHHNVSIQEGIAMMTNFY